MALIIFRLVKSGKYRHGTIPGFQNMKIDRIDYESVRKQLVSKLRADDRFKDFNFEASGIATLINLLAYNSHQLGHYVYALNNEASIDSAQTRQAIYSKARGMGYTPKGMKSAIAEVIIKQETDVFPVDGFIVCHAGKRIAATASRADSARDFTNPDNVYLYDYERLPNGHFLFRSAPTIIYEGSWQKWEFVADSSVVYQDFIIKDKTIDIDSLRIFVKNDDADDGLEFYHAHSTMDIDAHTRAFYTTITHDGFVEIFFGADVFGKQPEHGQIIQCRYISSSGSLGNGCDRFQLPGFIIESKETSNSGSDGESLETTRFNAINHFQAQNRLITPDDYRSMILRYFRNLQAVNVWRGEDNFRKQYGKIFISIKPHYADALSWSAKREITRKLLTHTKKLGAEPIFLDPEFIDCEVDIVLTTLEDKASVSVESVQDKAVKAVQKYNDESLNVFNNMLSDVELNDRIRKASSHIASSFTRKLLKKKQRLDLTGIASNFVFFGNRLVPGSIKAHIMTDYISYDVYDVDGKLYARSINLESNHIKPCGDCDYASGTINYIHPVKHHQGEDRYHEVIFEAKPYNADVLSSFNNIVRISKVKVAYANT
nr:MAG TPA: Baseplate wedge protein [Caudoviricetes sp.]